MKLAAQQQPGLTDGTGLSDWRQSETILFSLHHAVLRAPLSNNVSADCGRPVR